MCSGNWTHSPRKKWIFRTERIWTPTRPVDGGFSFQLKSIRHWMELGDVEGLLFGQPLTVSHPSRRACRWPAAFWSRAKSRRYCWRWARLPFAPGRRRSTRGPVAWLPMVVSLYPTTESRSKQRRRHESKHWFCIYSRVPLTALSGSEDTSRQFNKPKRHRCGQNNI